MKKFTLLLFAVIVMINAAAQQINTKQKVTNENKTAPGDITGNLFINDFKQGSNIPFLFIPDNQNLKSSTYKIKLDSVVVTRTYEKKNIYRFFTREYKYNDQFNLSELVEREKVLKNNEWQWIITGKTNFKYNDSGLIIEIMFSSLNKGSQLLEEQMNHNFFYNESGKLERTNVYFFENQKWNPFINCSFLYNNQGKLIKADLFEAWYGLYETPLPSVHNYKYSENGYIQEYSITGAYNILIEYKWDSSGNLVNELWNDYGYNQNSTIKYQYNSVGDITKRFSTLYYENQTEEYFYNDVNASEILNYNFSPLDLGSLIDPVVFSPKKQISMIQTWKGNGGDWSYSEKSVFFYSPINLKAEIFTSLKGINQSEISVYPNPATDQITFTWSGNVERLKLKLFQVTGTCVMDVEVYSGNSISLNNLPRGIYLYQLMKKQQIIKAEKIVIQ